MTPTIQHDVMLRGSDDEPAIQASKSLLASKSPVLDRMFHGSYKERDAPVIFLDYPTLVLQALVQYSESGELDLDMLLLDTTEDDCVLADEEAVLMIQLRDAANYFGMMTLFRAINKELADFLSHKEALPAICAVLNELFDRGQFGQEHSMAAVLMIIVSRESNRCFLSSNESNKGILACQPQLFCKLISAQLDKPLLVLTCLQLWCQAYSDLISQSLKKRLQFIANGLVLEKIPLGKLAKIEPCLLFTRDRLDQASNRRSKQLETLFETMTLANKSLNSSWSSTERSICTHPILGKNRDTASFFADGVVYPSTLFGMIKAFDNVGLSDNTGLDARVTAVWVSGFIGAEASVCNGTWYFFAKEREHTCFTKEAMFRGKPCLFSLEIRGVGCTISLVPNLTTGATTGSPSVNTGGMSGSGNYIQHRRQTLFIPSSSIPCGGANRYGVVPYLWDLESPDGKEPVPLEIVIDERFLSLTGTIRDLCPAHQEEKAAGSSTICRNEGVSIERVRQQQSRERQQKACVPRDAL